MKCETEDSSLGLTSKATARSKLSTYLRTHAVVVSQFDEREVELDKQRVVKAVRCNLYNAVVLLPHSEVYMQGQTGVFLLAND